MEIVEEVNMKLYVAQQEGLITVRYDGGDPVEYPVRDGAVDVEEADQSRFLSSVPGSSLEQLPGPVEVEENEGPPLEGDDGSKKGNIVSKPDKV